MIVKFSTSKVSIKIEKVVVEKETDKSVWIDGKRREKHSEYNQYHETYNDAYDYLESRNSKKVHAAKARLDIAENELMAVKALQKNV